MKKKLIVLGIAFLMLFSLVACKEDTDVLSNEEINQIKQLAVSFFDNAPLDEIKLYYYGKFNGNFVVMVFPGYGFGREAWNDIFEIEYPNTNRIMVWSSGSFYSLPESQEHGLLSTSDLEKIAEIHAREFENIYYNEETWI